MNMDEKLKRLGAKARAENPPSLDVVDGVMCRIQRVDRTEPLPSPWLWASAGSAFAAAAMLLVFSFSWGALSDPFTLVVIDLFGVIG